MAIKKVKLRRIHTGRGTMVVRTKDNAAKWLEEIRDRLAMSKTDFADYIGTTPQNYNNISFGRQYPSFENLSILQERGFNVLELLSGK